jgi:oxygen-dependent protoporphyrinogen oxidase
VSAAIGTSRFAVVGGGISGLTAAYRLRQRFPDAQILLFERENRLGGQLHTLDFAGGPTDVGAEAFVGRRPEVPALLAELDLTDQLVTPAGRRPLIYADGALHPLPTPTLMGIPASPEPLRGLVDDTTLARIAAEPRRPLVWAPGGDVAVAELVADRFGEQVVRRSVDPLLGGVYAGLAGTIGVRAALPGLAAALDRGASSLTAAVEQAMPPPSTDPVFGGIRDGYRMLVDALRRAAAPDECLGVTVDHLIDHVAGRWSLAAGGRRYDELDAVVVAAGVRWAESLFREVAPQMGRQLHRIETASPVLVVLAVQDPTVLPDNSGVLVATGESLRVKAFTLSSRKWPHLESRRLVRASFGRYGDDGHRWWTDEQLIAAAVEDLAHVLGRHGLDIPVEATEAVVQRWPAALPQYAPGHAAVVAEIRSAATGLPGIVLTGNYLDGVGVPACIAAATAAVKLLPR